MYVVLIHNNRALATKEAGRRNLALFKHCPSQSVPL